MRNAINAMADHHRRITPNFFEMVAQLIKLRGTAGLDGVVLDEVLADILEMHAASMPSKGTTTDSEEGHLNAAPRRGPSLHLVPKKQNV